MKMLLVLYLMLVGQKNFSLLRPQSCWGKSSSEECHAELGSAYHCIPVICTERLLDVGIYGAALKHGIRNPETETEYGIRERRFQAIDLKKNVSNDNK